MMSKRRAKVLSHGSLAGYLEELADGSWSFTYLQTYKGPLVSLTMPLRNEAYLFGKFPPFFEGLLPEGQQLENLLRVCKIDRNDAFAILLQTGQDLVGAITVEAADDAL